MKTAVLGQDVDGLVIYNRALIVRCSTWRGISASSPRPVVESATWPDKVRLTKSLYRYQAAVRTHLSVAAYSATAEQMVIGIVFGAAETMSDPADLISRAVEALEAAATDLPAFSTLDRLVGRLRDEVHGRLHNRVAARLAPENETVLDGLLAKFPDSVTTGFNRLK